MDTVESDFFIFKNSFSPRFIEHAINYRHLTLTLYHV